MKRIFAAAALLAVLAASALAQQHPNSARGFSAGTAYAVGDVDNLNVFNGNLIATIPIGPTYNVGGNLSYGLKLAYNGQLWSYRRPAAVEDVRRPVPATPSNVALGWHLSLGEFMPADWVPAPDMDGDGTDSFIGPDGAQHTFVPTMHDEEDNTPFKGGTELPDGTKIAGYTRDGSYMRLIDEGWQRVPRPAGVISDNYWAYRYAVHMSNGTIYRFRCAVPDDSTSRPITPRPEKAPYVLESITDVYGNRLHIEYWQGSVSLHYDPLSASQQRILELPAGTSTPRRTQYINFAYGTWIKDLRYEASQRFVSSVVLTAFDGTSATYTFDAPWTQISESCDASIYNKLSETSTAEADRRIWVRLLKTVTLADTASKYTFTYKELDLNDYRNCTVEGGHMLSLSTPAGGLISYTVGTRTFPQSIDRQLPEIPPAKFKQNQPPFRTSLAVVTRSVDAGSGAAVTTYDSRLRRYTNPIAAGEKRMAQELVVSAFHPAVDGAATGTRTLHYFTVDLKELDDPAYRGRVYEYGAPFTRAKELSWAPGYHLSAEELDTRGSAADVCASSDESDDALCDSYVMRRTYVKYADDKSPTPGGEQVLQGETPQTEVNRRQVGTITIQRVLNGSGNWTDDLSCGSTTVPCYTKNESSDFDGLGHFRAQTRTTNIPKADGTAPLSRTIRTNYDALKAFNPSHTPATYVSGGPNTAANYMIPGDKKWILDYYDKTAVREHDPSEAPATTAANALTTSEVCWDYTTGFMTRSKRIRGNHPVTGTALPDFLSVFTHLNGNLQTESHSLLTAGASTCGSTAPAPETKITHTWQHGTLAHSQYDGVSFPSLDLTIDQNTGLTKFSKDANGRATQYKYDVMGRLELVTPPAGAVSHYQYDVVSRPVVVYERQKESEAGATLTENRYIYDGMGRVTQEKRRMPGGSFATTKTTYDARGRKKTVTVPSFLVSPKFSTYKYDDLGRTIEVKEPDDSVITTEYGGARTMTRTVKVATNPSATGLAAQTDVKTTEVYDGFGRLVAVQECPLAAADKCVTSYTYDESDRLIGVLSGVQTRTFQFDRAGMLMREDHPESDATTYSYNARGKMLTKVTGSIISLGFTYDKAERLTNVRDNLAAKDLKTMTFDVPEKGRLGTQTRFNYFAANAPYYTVTDSFTYEANSGRLYTKETAIQKIIPNQALPPAEKFIQEFDYTSLSAPQHLNFPRCTTCGTAGTDERGLLLSYDNGLLTNIQGVTVPMATNLGLAIGPNAGISYTATGAVYRVQHAKNDGTAGVLDTYAPDASGLARPASIKFEAANDCDIIQVQPLDKYAPAGTNVQLIADVTNGAIVQWFRGVQGDTSTPMGAQTTVTEGKAILDLTAVTGDATYWLRATMTTGGCEDRSRTVSVQVCGPISITSPVNQPYTIGLDTPLTLAVDALGDNLTYQWTSQIGTGAPVAIGNGSSVVFRSATAGTYNIDVTITDPCGGVLTQRIAVVAVGATASQCKAEFWAPMDPVRVVAVPHAGTRLDATLVAVPATWQPLYYFRWYENDVLKRTDSAVASNTSSYNMFVHSTDKVVRVEAWVTCINPEPPGQTARINSAVVAGETYGTVHGRCTPPTVTVYPEAQEYLAIGDTVTFTADPNRRDVTYQWYEGNTGDTTKKIDGATTDKLTITAAGAKTYWVRVTTTIGDCGMTADSPTVTLSSPSCDPVVIQQQPYDATIAAGGSVTLSAIATANPAPNAYQWYRSPSSVITNAKSSSYTARPLKTTDYWLSIGNGCNSTTTRRARVHVTSCADINITAQPQDLSIAYGAAGTIGITATAADPLRYQWYSGESGDTTQPIAGATGPSLAAPSTVSNQYWVRVYFDDPGKCAIDSRTVTVTVCRAPQLVQEPSNVSSSIPGLTHVIGIDVTGERLTYEWFVGETAVEANRMVTTSDIAQVSPSDTTKYLVRVTSDCAPPLSDARIERIITVSVCPPITAQPTASKADAMPNTTATVSITSPRATLIEWYALPVDNSGPEVKFATGATATTPPITKDMWFYAKVTSGTCTHTSNSVKVRICDPFPLNWNNSIDREVKPSQYQVLGFTGIDSSTPHTTQWYIGDSGNTSNPTSTQEYLGVQPTVTTKYWARVTKTTADPVTNRGYLCTSDTSTLTITVCHPTITTQPVASQILDKTTNPSAFVTLSVAADAGPHTYQWYIGQPGVTTSPISGATGATYNASPNADTTYWVRVKSSCNITVDSTAATVTLCKAPAISTQPAANTNSNSGASQILSVTATGTDLTYAWYRGLPGDVSAPMSVTTASITVNPTVTTDYWVKVSGRCGSINSTAAKVSIKPTVTTPNGGEITSGTSATLTVSATGTQLSYQWYSYNGSTATPISGATSASYTTPALTADAMYICRVHSGTNFADTGIITVKVCQAKAITQNNHPHTSGSEVTLSIVSPAADETYDWYFNGSVIGSGTSIKVYPQVTSQYYARTKRATCYADSAVLTVTICYPKITTQPQSATVTMNSARTLTVAATGTAPVTYQWYRGVAGDQTQPIAGATAASYTTPALTATTSYWVKVSSPLGTGCTGSSVNSATATITVCNAPAITQQPFSQNLTSSQSTTLSVTATGDGLSYQWYEGAAGVTTTPVGTNSPEFTIKPTTTRSFWVRVTGSCGVVDSTVAQLSVYPAISAQPVDAAVCSLGDNATFSVTASGSSLTYVWYRRIGTAAWEVLPNTTSSISIPITSVPTYFRVGVKSGGATTYSNDVTATLTTKPTITSISRTTVYTGTHRLTANVPIEDQERGVTYTWYKGNLGDTSTIIGSSNYVTVTPTPPQTYWVRVRFDDNGCYADRSYSF